MGKAPKKRTSPIFWVGLLAVGAAAYVLTTPEAPKRPSPRRTLKKSAPAARNAIVRPEDYEAQFSLVVAPPKNVFKPLVVRRTKPVAVPGGTGIGATGEGGAESAVPLDLAAGTAGWRYAGMATVDGVPNALLENSATGESVFLTPNQRWLMVTVVRITPEALVLRGAAGNEVVITVNDDEPGASPPPTSGANGTGPAAPAGADAPGSVSVQPMEGTIDGRRERRRRRAGR